MSTSNSRSSGNFGRSSSTSSSGFGRSHTRSYRSANTNSSKTNSSKSHNSNQSTNNDKNKLQQPNINVPPPLQQQPPLQQPAQSGGIFNTILNGYFFGMGSSLGRRTVDGVMGSSQSNTQTNKLENQVETSSIPSVDITKSVKLSEQIPSNCVQLNKNYLDCVEQINVDHCKHLYDDYISCIDKFKQINKTN